MNKGFRRADRIKPRWSYGHYRSRGRASYHHRRYYGHDRMIKRKTPEELAKEAKEDARMERVDRLEREKAERKWKRIGHNHDNDCHDAPCTKSCPAGKKRLTDESLKGKKLCSYCHCPTFEWEGFTYDSTFRDTDHELKEGMHEAFRMWTVCSECGMRDLVIDEVDLVTHFAPIILSTIKALAEN